MTGPTPRAEGGRGKTRAVSTPTGVTPTVLAPHPRCVMLRPMNVSDMKFVVGPDAENVMHNVTLGERRVSFGLDFWL